MHRTLFVRAVGAAMLGIATPSPAQPPVPRDSVIARIPLEAEQRSQLYPLAQTLLDSIGPRLTGSVEQRRATDWVLAPTAAGGFPRARSSTARGWNGAARSRTS